MSNVGLNSFITLPNVSQTPVAKPVPKLQPEAIKLPEPNVNFGPAMNDVNTFDLKKTKSYNMSLGLDDNKDKLSNQQYQINSGKFQSPSFKDNMMGVVDDARAKFGDKVVGTVAGAAVIGRIATGGSVSAPIGNGLTLKVSGKISSAPHITKDPYTFYNMPENHGHRGINFTLKKTF